MQARLVRYDARGDIEEEHRVHEDKTTIGRHLDNMIQILNPQVSKQHAAILPKGTGWEIQDLDSRNGVFVNDKRIRKRAKLKHGDTVAFGPAAFVFETSGSPDGWSDRLVIDGSAQASEMTLPGVALDKLRRRR